MDDGLMNGFWTSLMKCGIFSAAFDKRVGLAVSGEVHGGGENAPTISASAFNGGEVRGIRARVLSTSWWWKSSAELRVPLRKGVTAVTFAEMARGRNGSSVATYGVGVRLFGAFNVILIAKPDGFWDWRLLPIDRTM